MIQLYMDWGHWAVVSRVRLKKQDHIAYCLASVFQNFLLNAVWTILHSSWLNHYLLLKQTAWSDAEVHGLCDAQCWGTTWTILGWRLPRSYIGTVHGKEYVIGLHSPRTKIWKSACLARLQIKYQSCQWVKGYAFVLLYYAVSRMLQNLWELSIL